MKAPFPFNTTHTAIAIAYRNTTLIADSVCPRVAVGSKDFKYFVHDLGDNFTVPDTNVGRKSSPNEVEFGGSEKTASVADFGLEAKVPQDDIDNAPANYKPLNNAVEATSDLILLDREVRTSNLVFNSTSYQAGLKSVLSGTAQFNDKANSSPIDVIMDALDKMIIRGNTMTLGAEVASQLLRHPDILKGFHGNSGDKGKATLAYLADLFDLQNVYVGQARVNAARKGQTVNLQRSWGKHVSLSHLNPHANAMNQLPTFCLTAQYKTRVAGNKPDDSIGLRGGQLVRVGESVKELIIAQDLGYLIENAVA